MTPITITASARSMYLGCPRSHYWRVQRELVPAREEANEALRFGTLWHEVREARLLDRPFEWPVPTSHEETEMLCRLIAMDEAYTARFHTEDSQAGWKPEQVFRVRLPGFRGVWLAGKIDALKTGALVERKTTSRLSCGYIDRLPVDGQILHYCLAQRLLGNRINKAVYDIAIIPTLRMGQGETVDEYEARKAELQAKSTTGKPSTAKQKMPETQEDYIARLLPACQFVREELFVSDADVDRYHAELTELVRLMRYSQKKGLTGHLRSDGHCTKWNRVCGYLPLCKLDDRDAEAYAKEAYVHKAAHSELEE